MFATLPSAEAALSQAWVFGCSHGWDYGFESRRGRGCLSLVNFVFCQVEAPVLG
jgi:hypothetical protein